MSKITLNTAFAGLSKMRDWWPIVKSNFMAIVTGHNTLEDRVDNIVAGAGASNTEIVDARHSTVKDKDFTVLTDRLEESETELVAHKADNLQQAINVTNPPAGLSKIIFSGDEGAALNAILTYANTNKIDKVILTGNLSTSITISVPSGVRLLGVGQKNSSITGTTASMIIVELNGAVDSSVEDMQILGTSTMIALKVHNSSSDFAIKRLKLIGTSIGINIGYSWSGVIELCRTSAVLTGVALDAQANQISFIGCAIKSNGVIIQTISASAIKFTTCELTQYGSPNATPFTFSGEINNFKVDTCYLEGITATVTLITMTANVGDIRDIIFENCVCIGAISSLVYADGTGANQVYDISFINNVFIVTAIFNYFQRAHSFTFKGNTFDYLLTKPTNINFCINGELVSWNGSIPNGVSSIHSATLTKGLNYLEVGAGDWGAMIDFALKPFYSKQVSVEFEVQSDTDATIDIMVNANAAYISTVAISSSFKKYRLLISIGVDTDLITSVRLVTATILKIKNLKVSNGTNFEDISFDRQYLTAAPTDGTHTKGQAYLNAAPSIAGEAGSQYVVKEWISLTDAATNVLNTDWVENRVLTGT